MSMPLSYILLIASFVVSPMILHAEAPSCDLIQEAQRQVRAIRRLDFKKDVACRVYTRQQAKDFIQTTLAEELPQERLENEEYIFKTLRIIPQDYSYGKGLVDLYLSQIGGFYDPKDEFFAMAGWMPAMFQMPIMVHELTHGLQDQYYVLDTFLDSQTMTTDEILARSALVEGDATAVMIDYTRHLSGEKSLEAEDEITSLLLQNILGASLTKGFPGTPEGMRLMLLFPYTSGLRFAHTLLQKNTYREIDAVFYRPPVSTQEILHPEIYPRKNHQKKTFRLRRNMVRNNASLSVVHEDVLGEFGLALVLRALQVPHIEASRLATYWNIDRVMVFLNTEKQRTLEWRVQLRDYPRAKQLFTIFRSKFPIHQQENQSMQIEQVDRMVIVRHREHIRAL